MMDESGLPKTTAGLFGVAGSLYARRAALYASLAAIALGVQYVVGVLLPHTDGLVTGLGIIIDAFFVAAVSIGVAFDLAGQPADWSTVLLAANERWGVVSIVSVLFFIVFLVLEPYVFGSPDDTLYGFLVLPVVLFWGALSLGSVVASIEPVKTQLTLPFLALGKAMSVSLRWANVGRLAVLSVLVMLPTVANIGLAAFLTGRHVPDVMFWSSVPLDALTIGPLQALSTIFYVDFLRRARR
jgi:hypothetical protein